MTGALRRGGGHDLNSAELTGPGTFSRDPAGNLRFELHLGLKLGQTMPETSGTVPTNRHTTIPNDSRQISACFDDDPTFLKCEIAQPRQDAHLMSNRKGVGTGDHLEGLG